MNSLGTSVVIGELFGVIVGEPVVGTTSAGAGDVKSGEKEDGASEEGDTRVVVVGFGEGAFEGGDTGQIPHATGHTCLTRTFFFL